MNSFFGGIFIEKKKLEGEGIRYPIKLEYYKRINEDEIIKKENPKYGITVIKTEYIPNNTKVERKDIKYLSNDETKINNIYKIFKNNEVTPIAVEEIISDLSKKFF